VPGLGTSFGRGGATSFQQDLANADCILIQGSNMAECHPVGFQWVMEAKGRGATVIHVDPRYSRTSAVSDVHVPIRAGTDIVFLGALVRHVLETESYFRDYVVAFTNAPAIVGEAYADPEDLDGLFSGFDPETRSYDASKWQYEPEEPVDGADEHEQHSGSEHRETNRAHSYGSGGPAIPAKPKRDETLQHPRCVFQILRRHFARYTPEMVHEVCGVPPELFARVADALVRNSGRERTTALCYAVGWTHQSTGVQIIRTAAILQLLLGNIGRPGGGIMALRGHASIQGSTDIPTLFNLLPGYLPMPDARQHQTLEDYLVTDEGKAGFWGNKRSYMVSLLKAWWGDAATADNDFCYDYLPRLTGDHGTYKTGQAMIAGDIKGYFLLGQNPSVGTPNSKMARLGLANLDWLVVRDLVMIESATFWKDGPELETGEMRPEDIRTEVFFLPAAAHTEKDGTFTNTQRLLQWHHKAVDPPEDCRSELWFYYHLGRKIRERLADSTDERDRPLLDLTWDYPTHGPHDEPSADAVLREVNGTGSDGGALSSYLQLQEDGSTASGCWIYCGVYADEVNQAARRKPRSEQGYVAPEWGWAWPLNRRILYNRASADADGKPWSERKRYVWWDEEQRRWVGEDVADFEATKPPDYVPLPGAKAQAALSGTDAFVMQSDGKGWLYVPNGLQDGPLPTHYEPFESPYRNALYPQQSNPTREVLPAPYNLSNPTGDEPGSDVFPYVFTTYRLTEHHTAGGMSRFLPYLSELQPEFFCEVSPELARERGLVHGDYATIVTARTAVEARVLVTDRMMPLRVQGRVVHQIGLPYHWGQNGLSTGDSANDLIAVQLDPNVHIQTTKALTCDIRPGRRPRGEDLLRFVADYRTRAGVTLETGVAP
jgi:formate dehydrogenase major subunit